MQLAEDASVIEALLNWHHAQLRDGLNHVYVDNMLLPHVMVELIIKFTI